MQIVDEVIARARRRLALGAIAAAVADTAIVVAALGMMSMVGSEQPPELVRAALAITAAMVFLLALYLEHLRRARSSAFLLKQIDRDSGLDDLLVTVADRVAGATGFDELCALRLRTRSLFVARPIVGRRGSVAVAAVLGACALQMARTDVRAGSFTGSNEVVVAQAEEAITAMSPKATARRVPGEPSRERGSTPSVGEPASGGESESQGQDPHGTGIGTGALPGERSPAPGKSATNELLPGGQIGARPGAPMGGEVPSPTKPPRIVRREGSPQMGKPSQQPGCPTCKDPGKGDTNGSQSEPIAEKPLTGVDLPVSGKWGSAPPTEVLRAAGNDKRVGDALRETLGVEERALESQVRKEQVPARYASSIKAYFVALRAM